MEDFMHSITYVYNTKDCDVERARLLDTSRSVKIDKPRRQHELVQKKASWARKLLVFFSCIIQLLVCNGIGYGLGVMYAELVVVFNAKRAEAALIQSLNVGLATGSGILYAGMIRRYGPGKCISVATVISSIAMFVSAFSNGVWMIILCVGVVAGLCMCVNYFAAYITISLMFSKDSGIFLMGLTSGTSLGQFIVPFLYEHFIAQYSWSGAFILLSGVLLNCLPFALIIHYSKDFFHKFNTPLNNQSKVSAFCDVTLLTNCVIWIIWTNCFLFAISGNVEAWFIVDHVVSFGLSRSSRSLMVSAIGIGTLFGRIIGVCIRIGCTKTPTLYHWIYMFIFTAALHVFITNVTGFLPLLLGCFLIGISMGTAAAQTPTIMFEASGLDKYPQAMAMVNVMYGLGECVSALGGGFVRDAFGKYDSVFYSASIISLYITASTAFVVIKQKRRSQKERNFGIDTSNEKQTLLK